MDRRSWLALVVAGSLAAAAGGARAQQNPAPEPEPAPAPGTPAAPEVVDEIRRTLAQAVGRFQARDEAGVLAHVSDRYRTGGFTKPQLAQQLRLLFAVHDQLSARVTIDEVRMIGEDAWVYTSGHVVGRPRFVGGSVPVFSWKAEPEVARREAGRWRLFGDQL